MIIETCAVGIMATNCYLLINKETKETVIIDPGAQASLIISKITDLNLKPVAILLTHGHFDHIMAAGHVAEEYGISIYASELEATLLSDSSLNCSNLIRDNFDIEADVLLHDRQKLNLAGFVIEVINTPGHTSGGVCYYLEDKKILFTGDTLFNESIGRTDFPTGDIRALLNSVAKQLFTLPEDVVVYPGHGDTTTIEHEKNNNPFLIEYRWQILIKFYINSNEFNNDLYNLARAFYPFTNVEIENVLNINEASDQDRNRPYNEIMIIASLEEEAIKLKAYKGSDEEYTFNESISSSYKRFYRNALKRLVYMSLSKIAKVSLSWGTLTGVRPTKIVLDMLENGESKESIASFMKDQYLCSDEKIDLSLQIAERELALLQEIDYKNGYSLYIGIPFCPNTCLYCSFASYSIEKFENQVELYLEALMKEISFASTYITDTKLTTIYIGGGTPTSLSENQLERLLAHIDKEIDFSNIKEYTVEAGRPDSITLEKLEILKKYKVSRISINPQSMSQKTLDIIGRKHTVDQVRQAFNLAREAGHDNINMDIIIGLPGENIDDVSYTLDEINKLNPESLTVHALAVKRAARLNEEIDKYKDLRPDDIGQMRRLTGEYTNSSGYNPYYLYRQKNVSDNIENIGYARPGRECLYNILMMEDKHNILALGAGAMSKFVYYDKPKVRRVENVKSLKDYIERIDEMIYRKINFKEEFL